MHASFAPSLAAAGLLLAAPAALAQHAAWRIGPTAGVTFATLRFGTSPPSNVATPLRGGFLAGATAAWQPSPSGHWGGLTGLRFTQQGYSWHFHSISGFASEENVRLNYLRLPVQATYGLRPGGQGLQLAAGPYLGVLLGGHHTYEENTGTSSGRGQVYAADAHTLEDALLNNLFVTPDFSAYFRRFDVGLQGSLGYRLGNALLHVTYTLGLRNLSVPTIYTQAGSVDFTYAGNATYTRGLEASLTYLLGPKG